jgi:hypothetical protein
MRCAVALGSLVVLLSFGCMQNRDLSSVSDDASSGGGPLPGFDGGDNCTRCSADLHSIVDCNNRVISTCPADEGCGTDGCVPACESADDNKSSIGCDYYAVDPDIIQEGAGSCFAAYVVNTWGSSITISVEHGGESLDGSMFSYIPTGSGQSITYQPLPGGQLPAGQIAIVFLAALSTGYAPCPAGVNVAYTAADGAIHGTGIRVAGAFHIITSAPAVAYDIFPYGGGQSAATSATLLLPTSVWNTNYIAVDAYKKSTDPGANPSMDIVAMEDGTSVTINPVAAIVAGTGVAGGPQGMAQSYVIGKGDVLQFTQAAELIGSPIQSTKPIGVWGAASCLNIDVTVGFCDSAHQQIPPVSALGFEYVAVRYRNRFDGMEESPPWRMVGAVNGTQLTYDPAPPAGAPSTLSAGQVAEFAAAGPFTVKSQDSNHAFYMSGHMTGCETVDPDADDCRGDPEFVNIIPPEQYLSSYVFFTDPTYPETNLVLVRKKTASGFADVTLDCAGVLSGWQPIGENGEYEYTRTDLVTGNFEPQGSCNNGRHEISSSAPFGLTVWGWGSAATGGVLGEKGGSGFYSQAVSYAYPAGASVQPINTVVVIP